jgi:hypothetical protein
MTADPRLQERFRAAADRALPPVDDALARVTGRVDRRRRARRLEAVVAVVIVIGAFGIGARLVSSPDGSRPSDDLPTPSEVPTEMSPERKAAAMEGMRVEGPPRGTETVLTPEEVAGFALDRIAADEVLVGGLVFRPRITSVVFIAPGEETPYGFTNDPFMVGLEPFGQNDDGWARWVVTFRGTTVECFYWCGVNGFGSYLLRDAPLGSEPAPVPGTGTYSVLDPDCVADVPGFVPPEQAGEKPCVVRAIVETPPPGGEG